MDIITIVVLLALLPDLPEMKINQRAARRANRIKAIAHNKRVYHDIIGYGIWFEEPKDGVYRRYASGQYHTNSQEGRWATTRIGGHRRYDKWCRDSYPSRTDEFARRRWEEELKEYFNS